MTLTDFLLARIAEDEAVAQAATSGPWYWQEDEMASRTADKTVIGAHGMHTEGFVECEPGDREHIARHHPARVLAECEAKQRIVRMHTYDADDPESRNPEAPCPQCGHYSTAGDCETLHILALPYADHPDHREEWKP